LIVGPDPERRALDLGLEPLDLTLARLLHHGDVCTQALEPDLQLTAQLLAALANEPTAAHPHVVVQPGNTPKACRAREGEK